MILRLPPLRRAARHRAAVRRRAVAVPALLIVLTGAVVVGVSTASPAEASATGLTLAVSADDTSTLAGDTSTTNAKVPTGGGAVTYTWGWSGTDSGSSATFAQTLPAGMEWTTASASSGCSVSGTRATGRTLSCVISGITNNPATTNKVATVHDVADGTVLSAQLVSGSNSTAAVSVTAIGVPSVGIDLVAGDAGFADGVQPGGSAAGLTMAYTFGLTVPRHSTEGTKGVESPTSPITFTVAMPAGALFNNCSTDADARAASLPYPAAAPSVEANTVPSSGVLGCSASGSTLTVTVTGADTSFQRFPTASKGGSSLTGLDRGYFSVGAFYLWKPLTDFSTTSATAVVAAVPSLSVTGLSGRPASAPVAGRSLGTTGVCAGQSAVTAAAAACMSVQLTALTLVESGSNSTVNAYPGYSVTNITRITAPAGTQKNLRDVTVCQVVDPGRLQFQSGSYSISSAYGITGLQSTVGNAQLNVDIKVEFGTNVYTTEAARKAADCTVGSWYSSPSLAPGGAGAVSAVKVTYLRDLTPSQAFDLSVPMVASTDPSLAAGTKLPFYDNRWATVVGGGSIATIRSTYTSATGTGSYGAQSTLSTARVQATSTFAETEVKPGAAAHVTIAPAVDQPIPSVTDGRPAVGVTVTTTLSDGCLTFVPGTPAPVSVVPATPAAPASGQTCKSVAGQVITWNLGNVASTPGVAEPTLPFTVNVDPGAPAPYLSTATTDIASASDNAPIAYRRSTGSITVTSVGVLQISSTASVSTASTAVPLTYRLSWRNGSSGALGQAYVVDVLPANADGRGTSGLAGLSLGAVTTSPAGLGVEYSARPVADLLTALAADATGATVPDWSVTAPSSGVTAIRIRTQSLNVGVSGYADVTVTPRSLARGGQLVNDLTSKADLQGSASRNAAVTTLPSSSAALAGTARLDVDYSGTATSGDTGRAGVVLSLTGYRLGANGLDDGGSGDDVTVPTAAATTGAGGGYAFAVAAGRYAVTVTGAPTGLDVITAPAGPVSAPAGGAVAGGDVLVQAHLAAPSLVADTAAVSAGAGVDVDVLANDTVAEAASPGPVATVTIAAAPLRGTATVRSDRSVGYLATPTWPTGVTGTSYTDALSYRVTSAQGGSAVATLTVTVHRLPVTTADAAQAPESGSTAIDVLGNDVGATLVLDTGAPPTTSGTGTAVLDAGAVRYSAGAHTWTGTATSYTETVTYHVRDGQGVTAPGQLTVTVVRAPVLTPDTALVAAAGTVTVDVLANDVIAAAPGTLAVTAPGSGSAAVVPAGVRFTAAAGQSGAVVMAYSVTDVLGQVTSSTVTVTVLIAPVTVADGTTATPWRMPAAATSLDVTANDVLPAGPLTLTATGAARGTLTVDQGTRSIEYTPALGSYGADSFSYTVTDAHAQTSTATVRVLVVAPPVLVADSASTTSAVPVTIDVLANDTTDSTAAVTVPAQPAGGSAVVVGRLVRFTPAAGETGTTVVRYAVTDDVGQRATSTATITVSAPVTTPVTTVAQPSTAAPTSRAPRFAGPTSTAPAVPTAAVPSAAVPSAAVPSSAVPSSVPTTSSAAPGTATPTGSAPAAARGRAGASDGPALDLQLDLAIGSAPAATGNRYTVRGSGLLPGSTYRVEMHSTPLTVAEGVVGADGTIELELELPADIESGQHTLTAFGTGSSGQEVQSQQAFAIGDDGHVSSVGETARSGSGWLWWPAGALVVLLAGSCWWLLLGRRRSDDEEADGELDVLSPGVAG